MLKRFEETKLKQPRWLANQENPQPKFKIYWYWNSRTLPSLSPVNILVVQNITGNIDLKPIIVLTDNILSLSVPYFAHLIVLGVQLHCIIMLSCVQNQLTVCKTNSK